MTQIVLSLSPKKIEMIVANRNIRLPEPSPTQKGAIEIGGSSDLNQALADTWAEIKKAFSLALYEGWEVAKAAVQKVKELVKNTSQRLGVEARLYRDRLVEQIHDCLAETYNVMVGSLQKQIKIGEINLPLKGIDVEFKMVFTGSVELSLTSLCKMVAEGQLAVKGSYGPASV